MSDGTDDGKGTTEAGGETVTFLDSLGTEMKGNALFTGLESAEQLAQKALDLNVNLEELKGAQPQVPETPEGYQFDAPEGKELDADAVKAFQGLAHDAKLSPEQAKAIMAFDVKRTEALNAADEEAAEKAIAQMKDDFGSEYDASASLAKKVLNAFDGAELLSTLGEDGKLLGNNPALFKFLVKVGSAISEDKLEVSTSPETGKEKKSVADTLYPNQGK